jgi:two-component system response regulator PilR (NtrC family)
MSVLVVEDDPSNRELLLRLLSRFGYDVRCAGTVTEAVTALAPLPSCILLDMTLPDGRGLQVLQHLHDTGVTVPVAILSGRHADDLPDARMLKPSAVFMKPVEFNELVAWL